MIDVTQIPLRHKDKIIYALSIQVEHLKSHNEWLLGKQKS